MLPYRRKHFESFFADFTFSWCLCCSPSLQIFFTSLLINLTTTHYLLVYCTGQSRVTLILCMTAYFLNASETGYSPGYSNEGHGGIFNWWQLDVCNIEVECQWSAPSWASVFIHIDQPLNELDSKNATVRYRRGAGWMQSMLKLFPSCTCIHHWGAMWEKTVLTTSSVIWKHGL